MSEQATGGHWVDTGLRPVLVAAMLACLAAPAVGMLEQLLPGWNGDYFLVFIFLANLEGILSERLLHRQRISGWSYLASRVAEALVLLFLLKLTSYLPLGWEQLRADALRWAVAPGEFVSPGDFFVGLLFIVVWIMSIHLSRLLSQLDVIEDKPPADKSSTEYYLWLTQPSLAPDRYRALEELGELFFLGGTLLLVGLTMLWFVSRGPLPLITSLGYFALGIILLSQAQFSVLQAGWQIQRIEVQPNIARRWLIWAAVFLTGVTLAVMALPAGYTVGPLRALLGVMSLLVYVITLILGVIIFLGSLLMSLIIPEIEAEPPEVQLPAAAMGTGGASGSQDWLQILLSALFWIIILAIAGYALIRFVRERLVRGEGQGGWWNRLLAWLRGLAQQWRTWRQEVQTRLGQRLARRQGVPPHIRAPGSFLSLRRLPPRELIRYFYLSTLRRAAQAGQPRRPAQTPYEYEADLNRALPELEPDLSGLTGAFITARYSPQPMQPEEAQAAKSFWQRIKEALRRRAR
jgi:hypothetical protein